MRLHLWCSAVLKVGQPKRKFWGSEKENVFTFTVGRNSLILASKCWQILHSAKHIILYTVTKKKMSFHRMNSTKKDIKSPTPSNYICLSTNIKFLETLKICRWGGKNNNQRLQTNWFCALLFHFKIRGTALLVSGARTCVCVCVRAWCACARACTDVLPL